METLGIKETKEALVFGARLVKAASGAMADGKLDLGDLTQLVPVAIAAGDAIEGYDKIWDEMQDLDASEIAELRATVDAELGSGAYDKMGKHILKAGIEVAAAVDAFKDMDQDAAPAE